MHIYTNMQTICFFMCVCAMLSCFICVWLFVTLWAIAHRLPCPWDSPDKNTVADCHALLQGLFFTQGLNPHLPHLPHLPYHRRIPYDSATGEAPPFFVHVPIDNEIWRHLKHLNKCTMKALTSRAIWFQSLRRYGKVLGIIDRR